ncbi:MAG: hypothetical protein KatS3mg094_559 [Candidatus Parcubacteria bacterium]|nr:MAG: hypothetical protein KatS3mg094_559 [Candidatus Parcubacteria bacterium]
MISNIFFFFSFFFILGIFSKYYFSLWFILAPLILILFLRYKFLAIIFCLAFLLGGGYLVVYQNFKSKSSDDSIVISRELPSTNYFKKYLGEFKGKNYFIYLPYYYDKLYPQDKINAVFTMVEDRIFIQDLFGVKKSIYYPIYKFRDYINSLIDKNYSLATSEIIGGILYGREINDKDIRENLRKSGLSHITAMSGYNLIVLSLFINRLFKFLPVSFLINNIFTILIILIFIVFTGFQSSVIRAGIMMVVFITSKLIGKPSLRRNVIIFTALLITFFNPLALINDLGFQLSLLATIGIIYFEEFLRNFLKFKFLSETISAQILVLPLIWYKFSEFNIFSFFNNALIISFIPFMMLLGFLAILFYFFYPVNQIFNLPFLIFLKLIGYLANFPKIYFPLPLLIIIAIYFFIFLLIFKINRNENIDFNFKLNNHY